MRDTFVRIFLVRHGQALANTEMRYVGSQDDPLTAHGQWQAGQVAQALASLPLTAVYTSPLQRAADTAAQIARARGCPLTPDPRLREAAMGEWEGLRRAEVLARSQQDADHLHRWEADPTCRPPGGESLADVQSRVVACVRDLAQHHPGDSIALVSHVGPIKGLLCAVMGVPLTAARRMFLDTATISVVDWGEESVPWASPAILRLFNAHHHLGWDAAQWMR